MESLMAGASPTGVTSAVVPGLPTGAFSQPGRLEVLQPSFFSGSCVVDGHVVWASNKIPAVGIKVVLYEGHVQSNDAEGFWTVADEAAADEEKAAARASGETNWTRTSEYGSEVAIATTDADGAFQFGNLTSGVYSVNWDDQYGPPYGDNNRHGPPVAVFASTFAIGRPTVLLVHPGALLPGQLMAVLQWGPPVGLESNPRDASWLGMEMMPPADLDLFADFDAGDSRCDVFYGRSQCGDVSLLNSDVLERSALGVSPIAVHGVETMLVTVTRNTTYRFSVGNFGDGEPGQALELSRARLHLFDAGGFVRTVRLPPLCSSPGNCPNYDVQHNAADVQTATSAGHWLGFGDPVGRNRAKASFARMMCVDNSGDGMRVHGCQRYFTRQGRQTDAMADRCPPPADRCLGAATGWRCGSELEGSAYTCPGGLASTQYCPAADPRCVNPTALLPATTTWEAAQQTMCVKAPPFIAALR